MRSWYLWIRTITKSPEWTWETHSTLRYSRTRKQESRRSFPWSEKGYDPVNQIVGYIMSGDPTYITNYMGARSLIMKVERDELVEEIMNDYIEFNHWNKK